jgi:insertion element IS1 protein InsB
MTQCIYCKGSSVKNGIKNKIQTYKCKVCKMYFRLNYRRKFSNYNKLIDKIVKLHKESVGIRGIGRLLEISPQTVIRFMRRKSDEILLELRKREITYNSTWEVDELHTFYKNKNQECWIAYALNHKTKEIIDFVVGSRSKAVIAPLINNLLLSNPTQIRTDKLLLYKYLIPISIHKTVVRCTNYIERKNLTLRNHIKRLNRKTLSFSKSLDMISVSMRLYFFG